MVNVQNNWFVLQDVQNMVLSIWSILQGDTWKIFNNLFLSLLVLSGAKTPFQAIKYLKHNTN